VLHGGGSREQETLSKRRVVWLGQFHELREVEPETEGFVGAEKRMKSTYAGRETCPESRILWECVSRKEKSYIETGEKRGNLRYKLQSREEEGKR